jgi:hypothetical protein
MSASAGSVQVRGVLEDWGLLSANAPQFGTSPPGGPIERVNLGGIILPMGVVPVP